VLRVSLRLISLSFWPILRGQKVYHHEEHEGHEVLSPRAKTQRTFSSCHDLSSVDE